MRGPADRPARAAPPPWGSPTSPPTPAPRGAFHERVTFDQRGAHAPALAATVNYGAQGTFYGPVTIGQGMAAPARRNRARLLAEVRDFWVAGVLEAALQGAALLALGLEQRPEAVADPWAPLVQRPGPAARAVAPGTRIGDVFGRAGGEPLLVPPEKQRPHPAV